ncbi:MAG: hypothetical protein ACRC0Q_14865 [Kurthia gibsonii]|uniref:Uncharacterized protein n=1 Tax=Kurthia gibsonii TaxID=33946 RepID=A0ABU9LM27_9BACL|nr:hypothetical protein [Kurthia gibsonii]RXH53272.1 hypothetical protein D6T70_01540 [Kurthia gibsonii]HZG12736.1 hypothetical protein [Kurthia gibsonii]
MIEKIKTEVVLDFNLGNEEDLKDTIDEMRAYTKEYENDKVSLLSLKEISHDLSSKKRYEIILEIERDTENLGRIYESEEEKLFGFYEDDE